MSADRATLFFDAVELSAVLVTTEHGRHQRHEHKFGDAVAALAWCIEQRIHFVLFWPSGVQHN